MQSRFMWYLALGTCCVLFLILLLIYLFISSFYPVDLVSDDYYERGIKYQEQIDRLYRTGGLEKKIEWEYISAKNSILLKFPDENVKGTIMFFRPSDALKDKFYPIILSGEAIQNINTESFARGLWRMKIYWEYQMDSYYNEEVVIIE